MSNIENTSRNEQITFVVKEYEGYLFSYLHHLLGNWHDAEDCLQETWKKVLESGVDTEEVENVKGWLVTIAARTAIDFRRRRKYGSIDVVEQQNILVSSEMAPPARMEQDEEVTMVAESIEKLSARTREILRLKYCEGLKHEEIADRLDIPVNTSKANIHRGLLQVQENLQDYILL